MNSIHIASIVGLIAALMIVPLVGAVSTTPFLGAITPPMEGSGTVSVTDKETGQTYQAFVAGSWMVNPGSCTDGDNGFKPETFSTVTWQDHKTKTVISVNETTQNGFTYEVVCGKDVTIAGVNKKTANKLAIAFWYQ